MIAILLSPLGKIGLYLAAALAVVASAAFVIHEHDARIRAEDAARVASVTAAAELAQVKAGSVALAAALGEAQERANRITTIKTEIARAPASQGCASSPSVRVALDGLRTAAGAGGGAAPGAAGTAGVPAAAGTAKPAAR